MGAILSVLAVLAYFPLLFSPFMAYGAYKDGNLGLAMKLGCIFLVCLVIVIAAPKSKSFEGDGCTRYSKFAEDC